MNTFKKITRSLSQVSRALAPTHIASSHCKRCGHETRWMVNLARGHFRCLECNASPEKANAEQEVPSGQDEPLQRA